MAASTAMSVGVVGTGRGSTSDTKDEGEGEPGVTIVLAKVKRAANVG